MRKWILYSLLLVVAFNAFRHAGEAHTYLGTVTILQRQDRDKDQAGRVWLLAGGWPQARRSSCSAIGC